MARRGQNAYRAWQMHTSTPGKFVACIALARRVCSDIDADDSDIEGVPANPGFSFRRGPVSQKRTSIKYNVIIRLLSTVVKVKNTHFVGRDPDGSVVPIF